MKDFFDWLLSSGDPPRERRRSPRYPAVPNWACLAWRAEGRTVEVTARLVNLSSVGAFVLTDKMPAVGLTAWIRLEEPTPTAWAQTRVVRRAGIRKVGLDFAMHCSYELFKASTQ